MELKAGQYQRELITVISARKLMDWALARDYRWVNFNWWFLQWSGLKRSWVPLYWTKVTSWWCKETNKILLNKFLITQKSWSDQISLSLPKWLEFVKKRQIKQHETNQISIQWFDEYWLRFRGFVFFFLF